MRKFKYTPDVLQTAIVSANSMSDVLRNLGLKVNGGNYRHIKMRIKSFNLNISHLKTGIAWARGLNSSHPAIAASAAANKTDFKDIFKRNSTIRLTSLKNKLIDYGIKYCCSVCSLYEWRDMPIRLHVDHMDGDTSNNLIDNLRFLCPNCHQQTPTWGFKSKRPKQTKNWHGRNKTSKCLICGAACHNKYCSIKCSALKQHRIEWPDNLKELVNSSSISAVARHLGVSDKSVAKRLRRSCSDSNRDGNF